MGPPPTWQVPAAALATSGNTAPVMIAKAFEDLRTNFVIPLLDEKQKEAQKFKNDKSDRQITQIQLYAMFGVVVTLKQQLDKLPSVFAVQAKPGSGDEDEAGDDESISDEVATKVGKLLGAI